MALPEGFSLLCEHGNLVAWQVSLLEKKVEGEVMKLEKKAEKGLDWALHDPYHNAFMRNPGPRGPTW